MANIPSDEEFARAMRFMEEDFRDLDVVCENVKRRFMPVWPLHDVYILPQSDVNFRAYVFFSKDKDIKACEDEGIVERIKALRGFVWVTLRL